MRYDPKRLNLAFMQAKQDCALPVGLRLHAMLHLSMNHRRQFVITKLCQASQEAWNGGTLGHHCKLLSLHMKRQVIYDGRDGKVIQVSEVEGQRGHPIFYLHWREADAPQGRNLKRNKRAARWHLGISVAG